MAKDFKIGSWVRREKMWPYRWHLVQSDVADAAITKCGKRMQAETRSGGKLISEDRTPWSNLCWTCDHL